MNDAFFTGWSARSARPLAVFLASLVVQREERTGAVVLTNTSAHAAPETLALDLAGTALDARTACPVLPRVKTVRSPSSSRVATATKGLASRSMNSAPPSLRWAMCIAQEKASSNQSPM